MKNGLAKVRRFPEHNYHAVWFNGKTIRQRIVEYRDIDELSYPEFYDVKITNKCHGQCPWCYQDSLPEAKHFDNIHDKIDSFFGKMSENEKPFQVAIGGGEPTEHPRFINILKQFDELGICPNYTTNGMNLTDNIIEATKKYCGGVAISCHGHLEKHWKEVVYKLTAEGIATNLHLIISDKTSIKNLEDVYNEFNNIVDYFVLLPHTASGRAEEKNIDYEYFENVLDKLDKKQIAFGALFYNFLKQKENKKYDVSLYQPETMSKYLNMDNMKLYNSSFNLKEWKNEINIA